MSAGCQLLPALLCGRRLALHVSPACGFCRTLEDLKSNLVICSVDATFARSAFFYRLKKNEDAKVTTGFGTHMRQSVGKQVGAGTRNSQHVALAVTQRPLAHSLPRPALPPALSCHLLCPVQPESSLCRVNGHTPEAPTMNLGELQPLTDAQKEQMDAWQVPFTFVHSNFKLEDVARATSAAPGYLPPCKDIKPITIDDEDFWQKDSV